jgi:hypothetical protein
VTPPETAVQLDLVDGLAFDPFGNLVAALEIPGLRGGLVLVDVETGEVTDLGGGISRADQVALLGRRFRETAEFLVTSEVSRAATSRRLFVVVVFYDDDGRPNHVRLPVAVATPLAIENPEGLAVIESDGPYGIAGTVYVAEASSGAGSSVSSRISAR